MKRAEKEDISRDKGGQGCEKIGDSRPEVVMPSRGQELATNPPQGFFIVLARWDEDRV